MDAANLPLHQISGRGGLCDPLGDYNVWTVPQGIPDDLSDRRIILVATKISTFLIWYVAHYGGKIIHVLRCTVHYISLFIVIAVSDICDDIIKVSHDVT